MKRKFEIKINKKYKLIKSVLILLIISSIIYIINFLKIKEEISKESKLLNTINIYKNEDIEQIAEGKIEQQPKQTEKTLKVKKLQEQNADIIGWIEIEGTNINYPVLQGKDNEYYMTHNYKKEKSKNGSIFLNKDYDWTIQSSNLLIYGHNLGNGTMFQDLLKYKDENFYKTHPKINFTTSKEETQYEIIAVLKSRVYYKSEENVFRYYYFVNAKNQQEYNNFIQNAKKESLYNIEKTAKYGEQLITLSTCSYHVKDGRFAVIGRKLNS